jgi:hypothetical protein
MEYQNVSLLERKNKLEKDFDEMKLLYDKQNVDHSKTREIINSLGKEKRKLELSNDQLSI